MSKSPSPPRAPYGSRSRHTVGVRLPPDLAAWLAVHCKANGTTQSAVIVGALKAVRLREAGAAC